MKAFDFDRHLIGNYAHFSRSFSTIRAADLRDALNNQLTGRTVTWTSSDPAVFALAATTGDSVTGTVAAGATTGQTATITATSEGVTAQVTVTVQ